MYTYEVTFNCLYNRSYIIHINANTRKEAIEKAKDKWYKDYFDKMEGIRASRVKDTFIRIEDFERIGY